MTNRLSSTCSLFAFLRVYPKNHCCFSNRSPALQYKNLMIFTIEIAKKYEKHEIKRLSCKRKENIKRERKAGAGRPFKLDVKNRYLMLLVYYRLYITYTLVGFLFDLDQSNVCRDIQKIGYGIWDMMRRCLPIPQKMYNLTKRLQTPEEVENISRLSCFHRFHRTSDIKTYR
jgi:hypothetical protein